MAQTLVFVAPAGLTITATARAQGSYSGGTAADSVTGQSGTNLYLAVFNTNLEAGDYRLDLVANTIAIGSPEYDDVSGSGTYYSRDMLGDLIKIPRRPTAIAAGGEYTKTNTSESPTEVITEVLS